MKHLNEVAELVDRAAEGAGRAALYADHNAGRTEHCAMIAKQAAESALALLLAEGATLKRQQEAKEAKQPEPIPFHKLDTPDVRALLELLRQALPIAERIDADRGRAWSEEVGGSKGWDIAEDVVQLVARLELELFGPSPAVTGGRE